jgi:hypothetical protein
MESDSDDLYDPSDSVPAGVQHRPENTEAKMEDVDEGEEEGEEIEEDDSDDVSCLSGSYSNFLLIKLQDDINFITDQKEEPKSEISQ